MDNTDSFLVDWSIRFLENKDVIRKEIINIEKDKCNFTIHYKDKIGRFFVEPVLGDDIFNILKNPKGIFGILRKTSGFSGKPEIRKSEFLSSPKIAKRFSSEIKNEDYIGFITLNNMANIKFVVSNWDKLIKFKFLSIYFINPFSTSDKVWIIRPYIHDRICDKASLELGLRSMAEMVNTINVEEISKKIKLLGEEYGL